MANLGDYPGGFILLSGDYEIQSKICLSKSPRLYGRVDSTAVCLTVFQSSFMLFEKNAWEKYLFDVKLVLLVLCC